MGRKNYRDKRARVRHVPSHAPEELQADWSVLMTNGYSFKRIVLTGTSVGVWNYAIRLGLNENDETMPGVWWPQDIKAREANTSLFTAL